MSRSPSTRAWPVWLRDLLDEEWEAEQGKRHERRHFAGGLLRVTSHNGNETQQTVRLYNVAFDGIGLTTRQPFSPGDELTIVPDDLPDIAVPESTVRLRVVHCTQTVQGFKVGCVIVT